MAAAAAELEAAYPLPRRGYVRTRALAWRKASPAIRLTGSAANADANAKMLKAGETARASVGLSISASYGGLVDSELRTRVIDARTDSAKAMFDLQQGGADARRMLKEYSFAAKLLAGRLSLSSYRRNSNLALFHDAAGNAAGELQQSHVSAALWRSARADWDADASVSRASAGYFDFGESLDPDLHAIDSAVTQYRSKLRLEAVTLSFAHRDTAALAATLPDGSHPARAETEAKATLDVPGLLGAAGLARYRSLLPDSLWLANNECRFRAGIADAAMPQVADRVSFGMARDFGASGISASFWRSQSQSLQNPAISYRAAAQALDVGSHVKLRNLSLTGNLSFLGGEDMTIGTGSAQSTVNCSFGAAWSTALGAILKAGVTTSSFENEFLDYGRMEQKHSFRYQLSVDLSEFAARSLQRNNIQLRLSASMQGDRDLTRNAAVSDAQTVFTGLHLSFPTQL